MDPGHKLMQHLKTVPNLVNEDPSTITPSNTSFVDIPWSDFSKMLANNRKASAEKPKESATSVSKGQETDYTFTSPEKGSVEDFSLGNWDSSTGYQDVEHKQQLNA
ncbi:hypothetical protein BDF21DRAFT_426488 [Thamnidium elegans]|uniref:Uncharacterized protein n=1 Tax=Thamnidium elegans TaxID=101142 RepID=A0A8H7VRG6_9FUNG|nr:hypothetical protein INT48_007655 [Thamnidium elegans]KAI8067360.1 hypothetical protein BDF21DRAFT_426488 [Thamnidium elegans]